MVEPMEANFKLEEADYFLTKLQSLESGMARYGSIDDITKEFAFKLSAFISAWRSVWDVLRHDFAETYSNVGRNEDLDWNKFKGIFNQKEDAKKIVKWLEYQFDILKKSPLWDIRNYNIHSGIIEVDREQRFFTEDSLATSGSMTSSDVFRTDRNHKPSASSRSDQNLRFTFRLGPSHRIGRGEIIIPICVEAIELMKRIVNEASEKFNFNKAPPTKTFTKG